MLQFLISLYRGSVMTSLFLLCHRLSSPFRCKDRWMACVNIPKSSSEPMDCSWTVWYTCLYWLYLHGWTWGGLFTYRRCWLLSACAYNSWQQGNMRLTADIRLTNSCLINGWENSGRCFRCFRKTAHSTWQSVKQVLWRASFVAVTFTSRSGGRLSERY